MQPETVRQRIALVDALRGFALMGLFIVHMVEYFELYWYRPEPGWVHNLIFFLFGGKAYGLFAMLFGLSFYIILDNYRRRGVDFRRRFVWRLTLLLAIGYLHSLLYAGDILQLLALCGLLLVPCWRLSTFWLGVIAVFFLAQVPTLIQLGWHGFAPDAGYTQPRFYSLMAANFEVFANGSLAELVQHNIWRGQTAKWAFFIETGRLWNIIGLMFAGALLGRTGFFEKTHTTPALVAGVVVSLALFALMKYLSVIVPPSLPAGMASWSGEQVLVYLGNLTLIGCGVLMFVLLFQTRMGARLLALWAPPGRMSLTFYLLQSVIFVPLYYGFGAAWYASIGQTSSLLLGIACWALQMVAASYYLRHYRYGPMEKLWRVATLYKLQGSNSVGPAKPNLSHDLKIE